VDVEVKDALLVDVLQGIEDVEERAKESLGRLVRRRAGRARRQRAAGDVLPGVEGHAVAIGVAEVVSARDLGMLERGDGAELLLDARAGARQQRLGADDF
jgi:hypothetical protein